MSTSPERFALHVAVMWNGVAFLPRLRRMTFVQRQTLLQEADDHAAKQPLDLTHGSQFQVPSWSDKLLTGRQVLALMVFGLWVQCGEKEEMTGSLLHDWPIIQDAVALVDLLSIGAIAGGSDG